MTSAGGERGLGATIDAVLLSSHDAVCRLMGAAWKSRSRPLLAATLATALTAPGFGCSRPTGQWVVVDDALLRTSETGDEGGHLVEECSCADETYAALRWPEGRWSFEAGLAWESLPQLVISGCLECSDAGPTGAQGRLHWVVRTPQGEYSDEISPSAGQGWFTSKTRLGVGPGRGSLSILSEVPRGCTLFLREIHVQSRTGWQDARRAPTQVLLISVDTLRHDVIGQLGSSVATPQLDRFAREAEVWLNHYAGASWTLASHATMLTGYPSWIHMAVRPDAVIRPSVPTLAERLGARGMATGAMVFDCGWLSPERGFARGFESYRVERWRVERQAREVLRWIREHRNQPFFYFFHTFEPHSDFHRLPYEAPAVNRGTVRDLFSVEDYGCRAGRCASMMLRGINEGIVPVEPYDAAILRYLYDAGVRHTDGALGELFDALREAGIWENLLVVVTSDHGEAFLEHDHVGHSSLHEEIIRVPLMVKWPDGVRAGKENALRSTSIDLVPTILEQVGVGAEGLPGLHLHRLDPDRAIFAGDFAKAVVTGDLKGIFGGPDDTNEVYDLNRDPGETENLSDRDATMRDQLIQLIRHRVRRDRERFADEGAGAAVETLRLTSEEEERLRALGYVE